MNDTSNDAPAASAAKSGEHWTRIDQKRVPVRRWYNFPQILAHMNQKVCGEPLERKGAGLNRRLEQILNGETLARGLSIGSGSGAKEMRLIGLGLVERFDLYEAAEGRVEQGRETARKNGLSDRVTFHLVTEDGFPDVAGYDLVYWNAALHHMLDVKAAVAFSADVLRPGGVFAIDEYVGPDRFQWTPLSLDAANRLRATLPRRMFENPDAPKKPFPRALKRPTVESVVRTDPTESVQSSRIVASVREVFPDAEIAITGGAMFHLVLRQIAGNMTERDDAKLIPLILLIDDLLAAQDDYHFATAVARKP